MHNTIFFIIILFSISSCDNKTIDDNCCNIDFSICEYIWEEAIRFNVRDRICDYCNYENNNTLINEEDFIEYLNINRLDNDSLIFFLNKINFEIEFTTDKIFGEVMKGKANAKTMKCAVISQDCNNADSTVYLFFQPLGECKRRVQKKEEEVLCFYRGAPNWLFEKKGLFNTKVNLIRNDFFLNLYEDGEYFYRKDVENRNEKRLTEIICSKKPDNFNRWHCEVGISEHESEEHVSTVKIMMNEFLDSSSLVRILPVDSIKIPIYFYEKDQTQFYSGKHR